MKKRYLLGAVAGLATIFIAPKAYSHIKEKSDLKFDVYSKLENVIGLMEQYAIEYNEELYREVYFFTKGVGKDFDYNGARIQRALRVLVDVEKRLLNEEFGGIYRDMIEVISELEFYFETLEDTGAI